MEVDCRRSIISEWIGVSLRIRGEANSAFVTRIVAIKLIDWRLPDPTESDIHYNVPSVPWRPDGLRDLLLLLENTPMRERLAQLMFLPNPGPSVFAAWAARLLFPRPQQDRIAGDLRMKRPPGAGRDR